MLTEKHSNNNNNKKQPCSTTEDSYPLALKCWVILPGEESRLIKVCVEDKGNIEWNERRKL